MKFLYRPKKYDGFEIDDDCVYVFKNLYKIIFEFYIYNTYIICGKTCFYKEGVYYGNKTYKYCRFNKAIRKLQTINSMNVFK